jgi:hypothetical protein
MAVGDQVHPAHLSWIHGQAVSDEVQGSFHAEEGLRLPKVTQTADRRLPWFGRKNIHVPPKIDKK